MRYFLCSFLVILGIQADDSPIVEIIPQQVVVGERAELVIRSSAEHYPPDRLPAVANITWLDETPLKSQEEGKHTTRIGFVADRPGDYEFPKIGFIHGEKAALLAPNPLKVIPSGLEPDDLFMRIECDLKEVYVGQEVPIVARAYYHEDIRVSEAMFDRSPLPRIHLENVSYRRFADARPDQRILITKETGEVNNRKFFAMTYRFTIFPQEPGSLVCQTDTHVPVLYKQDDTENEFLSAWKSAPDMLLRHPLEATPLELKVLPLPPCAEDESLDLGLIGDFRLGLTAGAEQIRVGDDLTLRLTIRGDGNLEYLKEPKLDVPGFEVYDPEMEIDVENMSAAIQWVIVAKAGAKQVPALSVRSFSPTSAAWQVARLEVGTTVLQPSTASAKEAVILPLYTSNMMRLDQGRVEVPLLRLVVLAAVGPAMFIIVLVYCRIRLKPHELRLRDTLRAVEKEWPTADDTQRRKLISGTLLDGLREYYDLPPGTGADEILDRLEPAELRDQLCRQISDSYNPIPFVVEIQPVLKLLRGLLAVLAIWGGGVMANESGTAEEFYRMGDFGQARRDFEYRLASPQACIADLVNLGHSHFAREEYVQALLSYERALRWIPRDESLHIYRNRCLTQLEFPRPMLYRRALARVHPSEVALTALAIWFIGWGIAAMLRLFRRRLDWRVFMLTIVCASVLFGFYLHQKQNYWHPQRYLVVEQAIRYRLPAVLDTDAEAIKPGTSVVVLSKREGWAQLSVSGKITWVHDTAVEAISFPLR